MNFDIEQVKKEIQPINFFRKQEYSGHVKEYFKFYGFHEGNVPHYSGTVNSGENSIYVHVYVPEHYTAVIFLLHGYQDHSGILAPAIENFINQKYAVVTYDMQGYGLSSGTRAGITDFSEYAKTLSDLLNETQNHLHGPYHIAGHSMGCAVILDYLFEHGIIPFEKVIFIAPLVKSRWWKLSRLGHLAAKKIIKKIPRKFRKDCGNKEFLKFYKNDPLQYRYVHLSWVRALFKWNRRIKKSFTNYKPALVLQGQNDIIVDWDWNIKFLRKKLPNAKVIYLETGNHQLLNELPAVRERVFYFINSYLKQG